MAATPLFTTANRENAVTEEVATVNLLSPEMIVSSTGFVNERETPAKMLDGNPMTKWCDVTGNPPTVVFDLGKPTEIKGWKLLNAGGEDPSYVTSGCYLMGRNSTNEDWHTIDGFAGNRHNVVNRKLKTPETVRYVKLMITAPTQEAGVMTTRINEFEVY